MEFIADFEERLEIFGNLEGTPGVVHLYLYKQVELIVQAVNRYKDLKTNAGLQAQLRQLAILEEAQNEKLLYYNDAVDRMNWYINTFPSSIIAQINEVKPPPPRYDR